MEWDPYHTVTGWMPLTFTLSKPDCCVPTLLCAGKYFMDTPVSHRLICSNSRLKTVHVGTATRSFPLLQTPILERDFFTIRCIPVWNSLSSGTVCATTLSSFKHGLDHDSSEALYAFADWYLLMHCLSRCAHSLDRPQNTYILRTHVGSITLC